MTNVLGRLFDRITSIPRNVKKGIINIFQYLPIIWNDRDWDQYFLYILLRFKLKRMEKLHRYHSHLVNGKEYADQMKLCCLLIDRIIEDNYLENALHFHNKKWGEIKITSTKIEGSDLCSFDYKIENVITDEDDKLERKERSRLYKHADSQKQQDINYLFRKMSKHISGWWD